jgi:hypothetical protein
MAIYQTARPVVQPKAQAPVSSVKERLAQYKHAATTSGGMEARNPVPESPAAPAGLSIKERMQNYAKNASGRG